MGVVTVVVSESCYLYRYSIRNSGHSDTLMTVTFVQLHLTISVNIVIIIAPKFYFVSHSLQFIIHSVAIIHSKANICKLFIYIFKR